MWEVGKDTKLHTDIQAPCLGKCSQLCLSLLELIIILVSVNTTLCLWLFGQMIKYKPITYAPEFDLSGGKGGKAPWKCLSFPGESRGNLPHRTGIPCRARMASGYTVDEALRAAWLLLLYKLSSIPFRAKWLCLKNCERKCQRYWGLKERRKHFGGRKSQEKIVLKSILNKH